MDGVVGDDTLRREMNPWQALVGRPERDGDILGRKLSELTRSVNEQQRGLHRFDAGKLARQRVPFEGKTQIEDLEELPLRIRREISVLPVIVPFDSGGFSAVAWIARGIGRGQAVFGPTAVEEIDALQIIPDAQGHEMHRRVAVKRQFQLPEEIQPAALSHDIAALVVKISFGKDQLVEFDRLVGSGG